MKWPSKKTIFGCDERGDGDSAYLTRWTLFNWRGVRVYFHVFHRSDADELHDHPWWFVTCILWNGYVEHTPHGKRRVWPGMVLYRPATWAHRVELLPGRKAATLVIAGPYVRQWGFFTGEGWKHFRTYFAEKGC